MSRESFDSALVKVALSLACHFGARGEDAEDIAQEALLKFITYGDTIEDPVAWLYVVVRRLHARVSSLPEEQRLAPGLVDPWPAVDLRIDARRLLARLRLRDRLSVYLAFEGYSEREMAAKLACSVKATEKSLNRARRSLRGFRSSR